MNHKTPPFKAFEGSMYNHEGQRSPLIFLSSGVVSTLGSALRNNLLNIQKGQSELIQLWVSGDHRASVLEPDSTDA